MIAAVDEQLERKLKETPRERYLALFLLLPSEARLWAKTDKRVSEVDQLADW